MTVNTYVTLGSAPVQLGVSEAFSTAGNITLSAGYQSLVIVLNGTAASTCTITLPDNPGSVWFFDISGVTLGVSSLVFTTGTGTAATVVAASLSTGKKLLTVCVTAANLVSFG